MQNLERSYEQNTISHIATCLQTYLDPSDNLYKFAVRTESLPSFPRKNISNMQKMSIYYETCHAVI